MKIISWNVNGIRAVQKKGFKDYLKKEDPDIICLQEIKAKEDQIVLDVNGYTQVYNSADRAGYSGTAIFSKIEPKQLIFDIRDLETGERIQIEDKYGDPNTEGRVTTAEFETFILSTVYTPNSKGDLTRLSLRKALWDPAYLKFMKDLEKKYKKPVIFCGDLNVAHEEIDLARPKDNEGKHGFTKEEREGFDEMVNAGFIDSFRKFNKEPNQYTWWTHWGKARERNVGWRIDYFLVSKDLEDNLKDAFIRPEVMGSDHCPVGIEIED